MNIFQKIKKWIKSLFCKEEKVIELLPFKPYLWDMERLEDVKEHHPELVEQVIFMANQYIPQPPEYDCPPPVMITDKPKVFIEDTHEYVSLAPYFWENPDTVGGIPWIERDGEVNPNAQFYDLHRLEALIDKLRWLSLAYYFTGDERYYKFAVEQINVWFINQETRMYPKMEYCQIAIGHNDNKGINTFESYYFIQVFEAIALLNQYSPFANDFTYKLKLWLRDFIKFIETSKQGQFENSMENNHGIMYDTGLIYFKILADGKLDKKLVKRLYGRIKSQIKEDGSQPEELKRNRAYHYSVYNLDHMIDAVDIIEGAGMEVDMDILILISDAVKFLARFSKDSFHNSGYTEIGDWAACDDYFIRTAYRMGFGSYDLLTKDYMTL